MSRFDEQSLMLSDENQETALKHSMSPQGEQSGYKVNVFERYSFTGIFSCAPERIHPIHFAQ